MDWQSEPRLVYTLTLSLRVRIRLGDKRRSVLIRSLPDVPRAFVRFFRPFHGQTGNRIFWLIFLTVLMSYSEGIGIALFFPLLTVGQGGQDSLSSFLASILNSLNISPTPL